MYCSCFHVQLYAFCSATKSPNLGCTMLLRSFVVPCKASRRSTWLTTRVPGHFTDDFCGDTVAKSESQVENGVVDPII